MRIRGSIGSHQRIDGSTMKEAVRRGEAALDPMLLEA